MKQYKISYIGIWGFGNISLCPSENLEGTRFSFVFTKQGSIMIKILVT